MEGKIKIPYIPYKTKAGLSVLRSINNVAVFVRTARKYGVAPTDILDGTGIEMSALDDPHRIITTAQEIMVGRRLAQLAPISWIGLELGKQHHLISKGKLGMAAMCCETARHAIKLLISNIDLASPYFQYDITVEGDRGCIRLKELTSLKDLRRFICETEMVSLNTMFSLIPDEAHTLKEMHFAYPAPDYADQYKEIFQCPFFNAREHLLILMRRFSINL